MIYETKLEPRNWTKICNLFDYFFDEFELIYVLCLHRKCSPDEIHDLIPTVNRCIWSILGEDKKEFDSEIYQITCLVLSILKYPSFIPELKQKTNEIYYRVCHSRDCTPRELHNAIENSKQEILEFLRKNDPQAMKATYKPWWLY